LRREGPEYVSRKLFAADKGTVVVVNAADEADMDVVVLGVLEGMSSLPLCSPFTFPGQCLFQLHACASTR